MAAFIFVVVRIQMPSRRSIVTTCAINHGEADEISTMRCPELTEPSAVKNSRRKIRSDAASAETISRAGVVRLAMLALPQQAKYVNKRMVDDRDLILLSRGLPLQQSLADALTQRAFRECFLPDEVPLPRTDQEFNKLLESRRSQLSDVADRIAGIVFKKDGSSPDACFQKPGERGRRPIGAI